MLTGRQWVVAEQWHGHDCIIIARRQAGRVARLQSNQSDMELDGRPVHPSVRREGKLSCLSPDARGGVCCPPSIRASKAAAVCIAVTASLNARRAFA